MTNKEYDTLAEKYEHATRAIYKKLQKGNGIRESYWWKGKKVPAESIHGWCDHLKTWTYPDKKKVFVSEPYHIFNEDILEMARLIKDGWDFSIDGASPHFIGRTVCIKVSRQ